MPENTIAQNYPENTIAQNYELELKEYPKVFRRPQPTRASAIVTVTKSLVKATYSECYSDGATGMSAIMFFGDNSVARAGIGPTGIFFQADGSTKCRDITLSVAARNGYEKIETQRMLELIVTGRLYDPDQQPENDTVADRTA